MLTAKTIPGQHENRPLTHRDCLIAKILSAAGCADPGGLRVQVRRAHPEGVYWICGQVRELGGGGVNSAEWFKVDTEIGTMWVEGRNARLCSGDGRCTCEPEAIVSAPTAQTQQSCGIQRGCEVQPAGQPSR